MEHSDLMQPETLRAIEGRCDAARPGPWRSMVEGRDHTSGSNVIVVGPPGSDLDDIELLNGTAADQDFVATARTGVPALLTEIRELRRRLGIEGF